MAVGDTTAPVEVITGERRLHWKDCFDVDSVALVTREEEKLLLIVLGVQGSPIADTLTARASTPRAKRN